MQMNYKELQFAYKYPFSKESKKIISENGERLEERVFNYGLLRVQRAIDKKEFPIDSSLSDSIMVMHLLSYVYARMIVSASGSLSTLKSFCHNEAKRSIIALLEDTQENVEKITEELEIRIKKDNNLFLIGFEDYLRNMPKVDEFKLIKQNLKNGVIKMNKDELSKFLFKRMEIEIQKNLPIPKSDLPKEALEYSKKLKIPVEKINVNLKNDSKYLWINRLLSKPIPDVRHRTVNLILAPYFTTVLGLSEEEAIKVINRYIEKCKEINPDTNVNETYIRYQVKYSKAKGMKPLSYEKAKELLGDEI
ncbi:MAG: DNA primase noncatalytic subunit PriX [Candidatus Micrarchaeaceae archaeon]